MFNIYLSGLLVVLMLAIATGMDLKKREVTNKLWEIFAGIGLLLAIYYNGWSVSGWISFALTVFITFVFVELLIYLGQRTELLFIGPADLKALLIISIFFYPWMGFAFQVFLLALIMSLVFVAKVVWHNVSDPEKTVFKYKKQQWVLFLTAYPQKISKIKDFFLSPMEEIKLIKRGKKWIEKRRARTLPLIEPEKEIMELKKMAKQKKIRDSILVSPLPAFMLFELMAFIIWFIVYLM